MTEYEDKIKGEMGDKDRVKKGKRESMSWVE